MNNIEYVSIDKDILDFLKVIYFGAITDPMEAASDRAYRDFNRTIRFNNMPQERRDFLRHTVTHFSKKKYLHLSMLGCQTKMPMTHGIIKHVNKSVPLIEMPGLNSTMVKHKNGLI